MYSETRDVSLVKEAVDAVGSSRKTCLCLFLQKIQKRSQSAYVLCLEVVKIFGQAETW